MKVMHSAIAVLFCWFVPPFDTIYCFKDTFITLRASTPSAPEKRTYILSVNDDRSSSTCLRRQTFTVWAVSPWPSLFKPLLCAGIKGPVCRIKRCLFDLSTIVAWNSFVFFWTLLILVTQTAGLRRVPCGSLSLGGAKNRSLRFHIGPIRSDGWTNWWEMITPFVFGWLHWALYLAVVACCDGENRSLLLLRSLWKFFSGLILMKRSLLQIRTLFPAVSPRNASAGLQ